MKRNQIRKNNWGKIIPESGGGFLDPPNYPTHHYSVKSLFGDTFFMSLPAAIEAEWLDDETRSKARAIINRWQKLPMDHPDIQDWIHQVLGYFRGCYQGQNGSWNAGDLSIEPDFDPIANQDRHAGVHLIRDFYPEYNLTKADLNSAYWGSKPT